MNDACRHQQPENTKPHAVYSGVRHRKLVARYRFRIWSYKHTPQPHTYTYLSLTAWANPNVISGKWVTQMPGFIVSRIPGWPKTTRTRCSFKTRVSWLNPISVPRKSSDVKDGISLRLEQLNLHRHDVLIRLHQFITHLNTHLHRDRCFLHIGHHIVQTNARYAEGEFFALHARRGLRVADPVQRRMQLAREADRRLHISHVLITRGHRCCLQLADDAFNALYCHDFPLMVFYALKSNSLSMR